MFELIATLYLCLIEEAGVTVTMKKENDGLISVPRDETLSSRL
jgi:hypothetical protein